MSQTQSGGNWKAGLPLALVTAVLWGLLPIITKGMVCDFDPMTATWFRFAGATCIFGLMLSHGKPQSVLPKVSGRKAAILVLAILGMSGNFSFYTISFKFQSPSITQTVMQVGPLIIILGAAFFFRERIGRLQWIGVATLVLGLALFFNKRLPMIVSGADSQQAIGVGITLLSAAAFATYSLSQKALMPEVRPETALFMALLVGTFLLLPFADFSELWKASATGLILLFLAVLNTIFAFLCFGEALRVWDASRVGAVIAMPPLVTVFCTGLVAKVIPDYVKPEGLNSLAVLGAFFVVAGCMMGALGKAKPGQAQDASLAPME